MRAAFQLSPVRKDLMTDRVDVSVVISTYNGGAILPRALDSVLGQDADDIAYEVIVVDNNSHDNTRAVVDSYLSRGSPGLRYVFEGRQGVSYGRNAGIEVARAPVIAFFDDDVHVSRNWLATIKRLMNEHPEVDFIGGKVLPVWSAPPPAWLTELHWAPLALVDYGPNPLLVNADRQLCLVSANLAVRRSLFESVGLFSPNLQRVKDGIGSVEDHELLIRAWRSGKQGLYAPNLIASTEVPQARMTKTYHRRWHRGHGAFCAMMRFLEASDEDGRYTGQPTANEAVTLFGVPGFLYRRVADEGCKWLLASLRRRPDLSLMHGNNVRFLASYINQRSRVDKAAHHRSGVVEVGSFASNLLLKKVRTALAGGQKRSA